MLLVSCGGGGDSSGGVTNNNPVSSAPKTLSIKITPEVVSLAKGQTQDFTCTVILPDGINDSTNCNWKLTDNPIGADTSGAGLSSSTVGKKDYKGGKVTLYTAAMVLFPQNVKLTVFYDDTNGARTEHNSNITVSDAKIKTVSLTFKDNDASPDDASVAKGVTSTATVIGTKTDDTTADLKGNVIFSLNKPEIIELPNNEGRFKSIGKGTVNVTAKYAVTDQTVGGGVVSTTNSFTVRKSEPVSQRIFFKWSQLAISEEQEILARFKMTDGTFENVPTPVLWKVSSLNTNAVLDSTTDNPVKFISDTTGDYKLSIAYGEYNSDASIKVLVDPDRVTPTASIKILQKRTVSTNMGYSVDIRIDATDDEGLHSFIVSNDTASFDSNSDWINFAGNSLNTTLNYTYVSTTRPAEDYSTDRLFLSVKDAAGNISDTTAFDTVLVVQAIDYTNTDGKNPLIGEQWYLKNTGQNAYSSSAGIAGSDLNIQPVHNSLGYKGKGVRVMVVDDSLEIEHEDLQPNILVSSNLNYSDDYYFNRSNLTLDPSPQYSEFNDNTGSHGTSVAGIIGMRDGNSKGGSGIAPLVSISGINYITYQKGYQFEAYALGLYGNTCFYGDNTFCNKVINTYNDLLVSKPQEADIFNMSYGSTSIIPNLFNAIAENGFYIGTDTLRNGKGAVYTKAAGNEFRIFRRSNTNSINCYSNAIVIIDTSNSKLNEFFVFRDEVNNPGTLGKIPCINASTEDQNSSPYVISTAASNANGDNASYSSSGANIWITGTGGEGGRNFPAMVTADRTGCGIGYDSRVDTDFNSGKNSNNTECKYVNIFNGTSSATPSMSGVAALMLEANPNLSWLDVKHILGKTAKKPDLSASTRVDINTVIDNVTFTSYSSKSWGGNTAFNGGFNNNFGWGIADAEAAVKMALDPAFKTLGKTLTVKSTAYVDVSMDIPNLNIDGITSAVNTPAGGSAKIRFVSVDVDITHELLSEISIKLTNTTKNISSMLFWAPSGHIVPFNGSMHLTSNAFYDLTNDTNDEWQLQVNDTFETKKVVDNVLIETYSTPGVFKKWKLTLYTSP